MKVRNGFVSNSSTTSFCIYGTYIENVEDGDELDERAGKLGLYCRSNYDGDGYYVGRQWSGIKDNETGKQFKEDVEKKIKELTKEEVKCLTYEEAWYNG